MTNLGHGNVIIEPGLSLIPPNDVHVEENSDIRCYGDPRVQKREAALQCHPTGRHNHSREGHGG